MTGRGNRPAGQPGRAGNRGGIAVLLVGAVLLGLGAANLLMNVTGPSDGARLQPGQSVWKSDGVVVTPLHERPGGLRKGDVVVAVEGRSMESWADALFEPGAQRLKWELDQTVSYTVIRDGERLDVAVKLGRYPLGAILAQEWGLILFALVLQLVAAFVFFKRPADRAARPLFIAASALLCSTMNWTLGLQVRDLVGAGGFWLYQAPGIGAFLLSSAALLHFALTFPQPNPFVLRRPWVIPLLYLAPYVILGACNPPLADRALHAELEVGLLLPCNVIVYETTPGRTVVAAMAPLAALGIVGDNAELQRVAEEADARLRAALASLESTPTA